MSEGKWFFGRPALREGTVAGQKNGGHEAAKFREETSKKADKRLIVCCIAVYGAIALPFKNFVRRSICIS